MKSNWKRCGIALPGHITTTTCSENLWIACLCIEVILRNVRPSSCKHVSEIRRKQTQSDNCNSTTYLTRVHVNRASVTVEVNTVYTRRHRLVIRLIQTVLLRIDAIDGCCHSKSSEKEIIKTLSTIMFTPNSTPRVTCSLGRTKTSIEIVRHVLYGSLFVLGGRVTQKRISVIYILIEIIRRVTITNSIQWIILFFFL